MAGSAEAGRGEVVSHRGGGFRLEVRKVGCNKGTEALPRGVVDPHPCRQTCSGGLWLSLRAAGQWGAMPFEVPSGSVALFLLSSCWLRGAPWWGCAVAPGHAGLLSHISRVFWPRWVSCWEAFAHSALQREAGLHHTAGGLCHRDTEPLGWQTPAKANPLRQTPCPTTTTSLPRNPVPKCPSPTLRAQLWGW